MRIPNPGLIFLVLVFVPTTLFCRGSWDPSFSSGEGSASSGEALFTGAVRFRNGGPPCAECHSVSGLPFPGGGSFGPDLTRAYVKLGQTGLDATLQSLFFRAMTPIYDPRPLTPSEQSDLAAFLRAAGTRPGASASTPKVLAAACAGFVVLIVLTRVLGRDRIGSVRKNLVRRAAGARGTI